MVVTDRKGFPTSTTTSKLSKGCRKEFRLQGDSHNAPRQEAVAFYAQLGVQQSKNSGPSISDFQLRHHCGLLFRFGCLSSRHRCLHCHDYRECILYRLVSVSKLLHSHCERRSLAVVCHSTYKIILLTLCWDSMMWSWRSQTVNGATGSAFAIGFVNSYGQIGDAIGPQMFQDVYEPRYQLPFGLAMGLVSLCRLTNGYTWWVTRQT